MKTLFLVLFALLLSTSAFSQSDSTNKELEKLRTESGVDPTRISSKISFSSVTLNPKDDNYSTGFRSKLSIGIERWNFSLRYEYIGKYTNGGTEFKTGSNDLQFSLLNAFYVQGKHAFAGSVEFIIPTGSSGFSNEYFSATPAITYSYTISPSLIFAVQPQYTFHLFKNKLYPDLSVLTVRPFFAMFTKSGWFYVLEPRVVNDFTAKNFDVIISPIIGKSLGGGFNLTALAEFPLKKETFNNKGALYLFGIAKNF